MGFRDILNPLLPKKKKGNYYHEKKKSTPSLDKPIDPQRRQFLRWAAGGVVAAGGAALTANEIIKRQINEPLQTNPEKTPDVIVQPEPMTKNNLSKPVFKEQKPVVEPQIEITAPDKQENQRVIDELFKNIKLHKEIIINTNITEAAKAYWISKYESNNWPDLCRSLNRLQFWRAQLQEIFSHFQDPNLFLLTITESRFKIGDISPKGASGPFQFILQTARSYKLQIEQKIYDERLDPIYSGRACANNLQHLLEKFNNDYDLAISGYNGAFVWAYKNYKIEKGEPLQEMNYQDFLKFAQTDVNKFRREIIGTKEAGSYYTVRYGDTWGKLEQLFDLTEKQPNSWATKLRPAFEKLRAEHPERPPKGLQIPLAGLVEKEKEVLLHNYLSGYKENINYPAKYYALLEVIEKNKLNEFYPTKKIEWQEKEVDYYKMKYEVKKSDKSLADIRVSAAKELIKNWHLNITVRELLTYMASEVEIINTNGLKVTTGKHKGKIMFKPGMELTIRMRTLRQESLQDFAHDQEHFELLQFMNPAIRASKFKLPKGANIRIFSKDQMERVKEAKQAYEMTVAKERYAKK